MRRNVYDYTPPFDTVIVCTVTGSGHAGMISGFALSDRPGRRIIGIDASWTLATTTEQVTRIAGSKVLYGHLGGQPALPAYAGFPGLGSPERGLSD